MKTTAIMLSALRSLALAELERRHTDKALQSYISLAAELRVCEDDHAMERLCAWVIASVDNEEERQLAREAMRLINSAREEDRSGVSSKMTAMEAVSVLTEVKSLRLIAISLVDDLEAMAARAFDAAGSYRVMAVTRERTNPAEAKDLRQEEKRNLDIHDRAKKIIAALRLIRSPLFSEKETILKEKVIAPDSDVKMDAEEIATSHVVYGPENGSIIEHEANAMISEAKDETAYTTSSYVRARCALTVDVLNRLLARAKEKRQASGEQTG